jgi:hypothetical protein
MQIDLDVAVKLMEENEKLRERLYYFLDMWGDAYSAYNQPKKRQDERARDALSILGFTKQGKRQTSPAFKDILFHVYLQWTLKPEINIDEIKKIYPTIQTSTNPLSEREAISLLAEKYQMSLGAIRQHINTYMISERRRLKSADLPTDFLKTPPKL